MIRMPVRTRTATLPMTAPAMRPAEGPDELEAEASDVDEVVDCVVLRELSDDVRVACVMLCEASDDGPAASAEVRLAIGVN